MKKNKIKIISLIALTCIFLFTVVFLHLKQQSEYAAEMADLAGMYDAEMTARITWKDEVPIHPAAYWYDADHYILLPENEPKPAPFGRGSSSRGGAAKSFEEQSGKYYNYDEQTDYREKIIRVEVTDMDGDLDVTVEWVNAD